MNQKFKVTGMGCSACVAAVEKAVKNTEGITNVSVSLLENSMTVDFDENSTNTECIINAVKGAGYGAEIDTGAIKKSKSKEKSVLITRFLPSLCLLLPLVYLNMAGMLGLPYPAKISGYIQFVLSLAILIINRTYFVKGFKSIIHKAPGMDALISIGAGVSFIYSTYLLIIGSEGPFFFESAGMIFTLITLGKALEANSKAHTMDAIKALSDLMPEVVTVIRDNEERTIGFEALKKGDIVLIRAGEGISVDGTVIKGNGSIDKSALTGESIPEEAYVGDRVVSGSVLLDGYLMVEAEKTGTETTLYGIIEMVKNAASQKIPIERLADRISGFFVPIVVGISLLTLIIWLAVGKEFSFALNMAISVIVISCPCALGLATPTAVMAGTGNAARNGILIRSGECLETARNVDTVVLDKTGTITEGELNVTDIVTDGSTDEGKLLLMAAVLEAGSNHPYAKAIRSKALDIYEPSDIMAYFAKEVISIQGKGIMGNIDGKPYYCGNEKLLNENGVSTDSLAAEATRLRGEGKTVLFFSGDTYFGLFAIADMLKKDSKEAIALMKERGLDVILLTGDNRITAEAIGKEIGIDNIISEVLPNDKHNKVDELIKAGRHVAMVGDGINDAAALVKADVGIAVGNGTRIAIDSADFILMKNSVKDVAYIFSLSKKVLRIIKQNLFWAFIYNVIGIPIAAGALYSSFGITLTPMIAAGCMSISSLFVVTNALRLRK
ncbi:MAG: heavy metal translocating P-type ATPase [Lachnospiraceae bacterium]|nr:heavy metal translocating P-type ATPase [Lachnospiraceae bacterium]